MIQILKFLQNIDNLITYFFSNLSKEDKYLKKKFKNKSIILVDIGSNLGGYIDLVKKNISIKEAHIFEPSIKCYKEIKKKFNYKNFFIKNQAISNANTFKKFYESEVLSQSSLHNKKNKFNSNLKYSDIYNVQCLTLNKYFKNKSKSYKIDLIKIDAEGEDLNVLYSASKLLKNKQVKIIKIELLNSLDKKSKKSNINEIIFFLDKYNYCIDTITKTKFVNQKLLMMDVYFCKKEDRN